MKRALIVGINYVGTDYELRGCVNDASHMRGILSNIYNFDDVKVLIDKNATTENIKKSLNDLVNNCSSGDVLVFHYSGHGSQLPTDLEEDGYEEIICPIDINWKDKVITDQDLKEIFSKVPENVNVTVILDCCHSGSGLNLSDTYKPFMIKSSSVDRIKFIENPEVVIKNTHPVVWTAPTDLNACAMLIAACGENESSYDTLINGIAQGAATAAIIQSIKSNNFISYKYMVDEMQNFMTTFGYDQHPQLDGAYSLHKNEVFQSFSHEEKSIIEEDFLHPNYFAEFLILLLIIVAIILFIA